MSEAITLPTDFFNDLHTPTLKLMSDILSLLNINLTIIDVEGKYRFRNNSIIKVTKNLLSAPAIDLESWLDCVAAMQSKKRHIKEEIYKGRNYLSVKQPILKNKKVIGILVLSQDITEQKQAKHVKEQFIKEMEQDLRTPMVGILRLANLLQQDELNLIRATQIKKIEQSANALMAIFEDILEVSALGERPVTCKKFNVRNLLDEVSALLAAGFAFKKLSLEINCPDNLEFKTDRDRLAQIISQLLSNAVKFTPEGKIIISAQKVPFMMLSVQDTGIGIPSHQLLTIFEKFTRLHPTYLHSPLPDRGTGLGLYVAYQLANQIGATLMAHSHLGNGSKFQLAWAG